MGNRLSKITTRTGDDGSTGLGDGARVHKTDPRIVAIGEVDELNSWMGVLVTHAAASIHQDGTRELLSQIQNDLFDLGGELACPGMDVVRFDAATIVWLENVQQNLNTHMEPLVEFILPGGSIPASQAFLVRAVARRAERSVLAIQDDSHLNCSMYLNRLSDFLFVYGRYLNKRSGIAEVLWRHTRHVK